MGHKKRKTQYFTFLLIPDDEKATRSLRLKSWVIQFFIIMFIVIAVLLVIGFASYWKVAAVALDYNNLQEENQKLKESLTKVNQLQQDLDKLKKIDQKFRTSLSGYVKIIENEESGKGSDLLNNLETADIKSRERSLFNSVPALLPVEGFITRRYELNSLKKDAHLGIDIAAAKGSAVKAAADGIVIFSGWTFSEGNVVIIKHDMGFYTFYKHNLQNMCHELEYVRKAQVIALVGDTGQISSGAHLHFEVWQNSSPVNPALYINGI